MLSKGNHENRNAFFERREKQERKDSVATNRFSYQLGEGAVDKSQSFVLIEK